MSNYDQLKKVLNEIFELDKADLDFGIYRIMNQKRKQVNEFIDKQLPADISKALSETQTADKAELEGELKTLKKNLEDAGVVAAESPKYKLLNEKLALIDTTEVLEQEVFSHLANFFRRYYKDGDFISMRRYKKDVYAIPYEGEEVKLHWANADQYYIKSSENFKNYSFLLGDNSKVTFQLKEVSTEQNNNKTQGDAERRFAIFEEMPVEVLNGELLINFVYEPFPKATKQDALLAAAINVLTENVPAQFAGMFALSPTEKNSKRTLLEKHLNDYVSKNSFDYFIHKDLGGFLSRELDFYIKNEVLYIDDINARQTDFFVAQLSKVKAIKTVATKVIDFLAQIENFQKKLWLKKKFVLRTDYCITLDRIPADYYPEIFANKAQLSEWKALFNVELLNESQLAFEQFLVLDTKFFDEAFKDRLLAEFDDLDEQTNGLLINSENFQALGLMQEKYQERIDGVYIDPPYNTGSDGFVYKDGFNHSSWITMMNDRLPQSSKLLKNNGGILTSINENELFNLKHLYDVIGLNYFTTCDVRVRHENRILKGDKDFHEVTEQLLVYGKDEFRPGKREEDNTSFENYIFNVQLNGLPDFVENYDGKRVEVFKPDNFEVVESLPSITNLQKISIRGGLREGNSSGRFYVAHLESQFQERRGYLFKVEGMGGDGIGHRFFLIPEESSNRKNSDYFQGVPTNKSDVKFVPYPNFLDFEKHFNNCSQEGGVEFRNGKKPIAFIKHLFKLLNVDNSGFILDFFSGSGSTLHAAISENRSSKNYKYIGIEVNTYFNTVTKPRIQKVIYSDNWKNGKPQDKAGISQMFKYQVLESYEDTLNNLMLSGMGNQAQLDFSERAQEEYLLHYMLEMESREHLFNLEMFRKPFSYQLKVTENNELKPTNVDLVETFNYLIGLYVSKVQRVKDIKVVEGVTRTGIKTLVIWRDMETTTHDDVLKLVRRFYDSARTREFQQIYINGDHHLENLRTDGDQFKIKMIEETFFKKMFNESEL